MPQVFDVDTNKLKVKVSFADIRRFCLLRWLPYTTAMKPKLKLKLVQDKTSNFSITSLSIDCKDPKFIDDDDGMFKSNRNYYGYHTGNIKEDGGYLIELPPLITGGVEYEYRLRLNIQISDGGLVDSASTNWLIMTTGRVFYFENVIVSLLCFLAGSGFTYLINCLVG